MHLYCKDLFLEEFSKMGHVLDFISLSISNTDMIDLLSCPKTVVPSLNAQ